MAADEYSRFFFFIITLMPQTDFEKEMIWTRFEIAILHSHDVAWCKGANEV